MDRLRRARLTWAADERANRSRSSGNWLSTRRRNIRLRPGAATRERSWDFPPLTEFTTRTFDGSSGVRGRDGRRFGPRKNLDEAALCVWCFRLLNSQPVGRRCSGSDLSDEPAADSLARGLHGACVARRSTGDDDARPADRPSVRPRRGKRDSNACSSRRRTIRNARPGLAETSAELVAPGRPCPQAVSLPWNRVVDTRASSCDQARLRVGIPVRTIEDLAVAESGFSPD
jgi:hypothetical protein